jgi:hypothetical protein
MSDQPTGVDLIAAERARQKLATRDGGEGYTAEHDEDHADELARAAAAYALTPEQREWLTIEPGHNPMALGARLWVWHADYWRPTPDNRVRELTKAGALIAAAIDSLQAEENTSATKG